MRKIEIEREKKRLYMKYHCLFIRSRSWLGPSIQRKSMV